MTNLVNISAVQEGDNFVKAMMMYVNLDLAREQLKDCEDSGFGCLRAGVVQLYTNELNRVGGDRSKMDYAAIAGEFQISLRDAEEWLRNPACPKNYKEGVLPNSYKVAKSTLLSAIKKQFDFFKSPQIGSSKLAQWNRNIEAEREKAERMAEIEAAAKRNKDSGTKPTPVPSPGKQDDGKAEPNKPAEPTPAPAAQGDAPFEMGGLSEEQFKKAVELFNRLGVIANNDSQKIDSLLRGIETQTEKAFSRAMAAISKARNVA